MSAGSAATAPTGPRLSGVDATLLVMGGIVGVGIFFTPQRVAALVPHPGWFLALWALGGLVALAGAFTFAELGASYPRTGGWYVFLREAFGPFVAFLFAWIVLGVVSTGAAAVIADFGARMLARALPALGALGARGELATAAAILVLVTAAALRGAKAGATLQNACMLTKLAALAALIALGFLGAPAEAAPPPDAPPLWRGLALAVLPVLFTCGGWQMLCYIAPEVRDAQRAIPRAILAGVAGVVAIYLAANAAFLRALSPGGLAAEPDFAARIAERAGAAGATALQLDLAVSAIGICTVILLATPGVYVAMAREGLFFRRFGALHPRTGAPSAALAVQLAIALLYLAWSRSAVWLPGEPRFGADELVDSVVFAEWIFHALAALALLRLRSARPELPRPFRSPLYPLAPLLYLAVAAAVVAGTLAQADASRVSAGLAVLAAGALAYGPWRRLVGAVARSDAPPVD
jgi:APA family basic amino acid/polyamine antiporter